MTKGASERSRRRGRSAMMKARVFSTRASLLLLIGLINLQCAAFSHYSLLSLQTVSQKFSNVFLSQQGTLRYKSGALLSEDELEDDEMATFDEIMEGLMKDNGIPGAQLAVAKGGELKLFQGYGIAKRRQPRDHGDDHNMTTDHVMRISDLSRLITGVAVLQLVQDGRLELEDKAFMLLGHLEPPSNSKIDPRLHDITIRHLLQETAGWNVSASGREPSVVPGSLEVSQALGHASPPSAAAIVQFMKGLALDFDPGSGLEPCNFCFLVLGRVIEVISGLPYESYVKKNIFDAIGATSFRMGETKQEKLAAKEAHYYGQNGQTSSCLSVYPGQGYVQCDYGFGDLKVSANSYGGWVANAKDLALLALHIDGIRQPALLRDDLVREMLHARVPENRHGLSQGMLWTVRLAGDGRVRSLEQSGGAIPGSHSLLLRLVDDDATIAYLVNSRPARLDDFMVSASEILSLLARSIRNWPVDDLFLGPRLPDDHLLLKRSKIFR
ncbi:hypothetical protein MPTK1_2g08550 [Marchantia polymorpha subsp. ruderalis]|uniref:Beta-lactamase-related domain-containing protein n=1 Tax=Marchantia polymorpha TaxID=3197 RepID=A0A2R6XGV6_MARPO|nr:hypothetical protein MARPO_0015s0140 [Marchantia polymorpha]BBN01578.1 hypothetical protein Mp_2g08550 [Marchantia polymorpha subsp. ruderalis]|eukprot:PTQ45345.1 hypothetical protein MARPO_0015s0140 [Marchantia polymorpha]